MPVLETKGAASAQGYGLTTSQPDRVYIEDTFSTWLYTGNGNGQNILNGIRLGGGATSPGWIATLSGSGNDEGNSVAVDSSGNVYVCGFSDASGTEDFQIAKYNTSGVIQWQRRLGSSGNDRGLSLAVDSSGNVYVCGYSNASGTNDFQIAKYNTSGVIQWQRRLGGSGIDVGNSVAVDSSGNVYVCGRSNASGNFDFQLAKYSTNGVIQWQRRLGGSGSDVGQSVAVDSSGNVYVCGRSNASGTDDFQIAKYNTSGVIQWQRRLGGSSSSEGCYSVAVDSSGNVYVCGDTNASFGFIDFQIAKYNTSGVIQWQRRLGGSSSDDQALSVAVDSSGNVYVCGSSGASGTNDFQIAKYNTSGVIQWQRRLGGSGSDVGQSVAVDSSGNVYVCGYSDISGTLDLLLAKLPGDGSGSGTYIVGSSTFVYAPSFLTDGASSLTDAASSLTDAATSLTDAATSLTDAATSLTSSTTALIEGPGFGGLVWMKQRSSSATDHALYDTARGATFDIASNTTAAQTTQSTGLTNFLSNGFSIGSLAKVNTSSATYASWTFREQPKFFDVVTYTGTGANRTIAHNLGSVPGSIFVKRTDAAADWQVYHRSLANTQYLVLNSTATVATGATRWNSTTPTSTEFSLGTDATVNASGGTYVAYLFAHDAGGFGNGGADNVISCGSFTTDGSGASPFVSLGYEPQWIFYKSTSSTTTTQGAWQIVDSMRGLNSGPTVPNEPVLFPNNANAESAWPVISVSATGFQTTNQGFLAPSSTFIYIAIRRGPMKTPTVGTSVFGLNARTGTGAIATVTGGQTDDAVLIKNRGAAVASLFSSRLTSNSYAVTSSPNGEVAAGTTILQTNPWDVMDGVNVGSTSTITNASANTFINYLFRRAPGFFDVVCYTGIGANTTQTHNLGVVPELIIVKCRSASGAWQVYSNTLANTEYLVLNTTAAKTTGAMRWNSTTPTSTVFSLGTASEVNASSTTYIAYLFATVAGVSKIGSYTGTSATLTVNCGFTTGARFVLIKRTDVVGDWYVWDSARGIVAGNDPYIVLNSTAAQVTTTDWVDTASSGFELSNSVGNLANVVGGSYIFLSVA